MINAPPPALSIPVASTTPPAIAEDVLYVVPTFNRAAHLPRTLGAIAAQAWPDARKSILVVDNASTDDTPQVVEALARQLSCPVQYLRKAPEGPAVARNLGLHRGRDGYVALIDSDVELDPGWTAASMAAMRGDPALAQVGGKLVFAHDRAMLNSYGGAIGFLGLAWDRDEGAPAATATGPRDVLWINNAAVLVRPGPALAVGGFDAAFCFPYEEPDLGMRLAIAGWRARVVPDAIAVHHADMHVVASPPDFVFHYTKNRLRMGLKVFGPVWLAAFVVISLAYGLLDAALHRPRAARLRALWWNATHLHETWRRRRIAQAARRVPDATAFALLERRWFPPRRLAGLRRRAVAGSIVVRNADRGAAAGGVP